MYVAAAVLFQPARSTFEPAAREQQKFLYALLHCLEPSDFTRDLESTLTKRFAL
jgi:hypothetical protein